MELLRREANLPVKEFFSELEKPGTKLNGEWEKIKKNFNRLTNGTVQKSFEEFHEITKDCMVLDEAVREIKQMERDDYGKQRTIQIYDVSRPFKVKKQAENAATAMARMRDKVAQKTTTDGVAEQKSASHLTSVQKSNAAIAQAKQVKTLAQASL